MNEQKKLVPKLRFPEFRGAEGWQEKALGSVCNSFSGGTPNTSKSEYYGGDIPFIRSAEIARDSTELFLTREGLANSSAKMVIAGNILVALYGANSGDVAIAKIDGAINQAILCLKSKESNAFIYQFLSFKKDWIVATYIQGGQGNLSGEIVKSIAVAFPSLTEQQKIANCLSSLDELIAAQARKVEALKTHKKGLMQQLFPREGETQPRLRFSEFAGDWEIKTLKHACKMQAGKFISASEIKDKNSDGFFPCFGGNGLRGYTETHTHEGTYPLIGRQGALCGNVKLAESQFYATEHALVAAPNAGVHTVWLYYLLDFMNLNQYATGQAQPGLSVDVLNALSVAIPSQEKEQQRVADSLITVDGLIDASTQELDTLKTHKKGLMQQLFPYLEA